MVQTSGDGVQLETGTSDAGDNLVLEGQIVHQCKCTFSEMILHEINTDDINKVGQVDTYKFQQV